MDRDLKPIGAGDMVFPNAAAAAMMAADVRYEDVACLHRAALLQEQKPGCPLPRCVCIAIELFFFSE